MGRKKKRASSDPAARIFCYYCDRTFQTEQTLLTHQREKHLRCPTCHKRMLSIPSMAVHSSQMHNATIAKVPNAISGRDDVRIDVLGMKGIPDSYYASLDPAPAAKAQRTASQYPHAAPQPYGAYHTLQQYPYPNGAAAYHMHPYSSQGYAQNAYPQNGYAQMAYPSASYPQQSTYPQTTYQQPNYPSAPAAPYHYPYTHASSQYAQPHHYQSYSANPQYGLNVPYATAAPSLHVAKPVPHPATSTESGAQAPPVLAVGNAEILEQRKKDEVQIVFDRLDCSMEELRAKLPRYSTSS